MWSGVKSTGKLLTSPVCGSWVWLCRFGVVQKYVAVVGRSRLGERKVPLVSRDRAQVIFGIVAIDERTHVTSGADLVKVEGFRVAFVRRDEERSVVPRPTVEIGLQFLARGEIGDLAVRIPYVDVASARSHPGRLRKGSARREGSSPTTRYRSWSMM